MSEERRRITVAVDAKHVKQLDKWANQSDRSRSWVVRKLIAVVVNANAKANPETTQRGPS